MEWKPAYWDKDISRLEKIAKSTNNTVKYSQNTVWWGLFDEDNTARGCIGLLMIYGHRARMKSHYVEKEFRGKGYGTEGLHKAINYAFNVLELLEVEIITRHLDFWKARAFMPIKKNKNKYTMIITKEYYDKYWNDSVDDRHITSN
jgi:GNAT superfamily N-acetyltransferase